MLAVGATTLRDVCSGGPSQSIMECVCFDCVLFRWCSRLFSAAATDIAKMFVTASHPEAAKR
eukprot:6148549-Pleurochrysis_carterae.AAC.1